MMYRKGMLFEDLETAEEIMQARTPKSQKALGRKVSGFTDTVWCANRELIVVDGNWYKFTNPVDGSEDLKEKLLATGDRELVEVRIWGQQLSSKCHSLSADVISLVVKKASPRDRIWGIGFGAKNAGSQRKKWGQNLLGKCLMVVRDRIREEEELKLRKEEEDPVNEG